MEIKGMQARDICSIIKACAKSGVSELKLGDMQISFIEGSKIDIAAPDISALGDLGTDHSDVSHGNDAPPEQLELDNFSEDINQELDETQLMIDSPADFEQSIIDSYLENGHMDEEVSHEAYGRKRSERDISYI